MRIGADLIYRQFGCCLGDTLASEIGILSRSQPRLITNFRRVPPGTNGGMSVEGTAASVVGGLLVGVLVGVSLVVENQACRNGWRGVLVETAIWGMAAGGVGSLVSASWLGSNLFSNLQTARLTHGRHHPADALLSAQKNDY